MSNYWWINYKWSDIDVKWRFNKHSGEGNSRNIVDVSTAGDIVICRNKVVHKNQIQLHKPHFHFLLSAHIQSHSGEGNLGDTIEMQNIVN